MRNLFVLSLMVIAAGCGGGSSATKMYPVTGTITMDGAPLEGADVILIPASGGRAQSATTDSEGKYKTESIPGDHKVGVSKVETTGKAPESSDGLAPDFSKVPPPKTKVIVPAKYNSPATSNLTVKVPPSGGEVEPVPLLSK